MVMFRKPYKGFFPRKFGRIGSGRSSGSKLWEPESSYFTDQSCYLAEDHPPEEAEKMSPADFLGNVILLARPSEYRKTIVKLVENLGYLVFPADNFKQANILLAMLNVEFILIDIDSQSVSDDPATMLRLLLHKTPRLRVLLTGKGSEPGLLNEMMSAGACGHLPKPFECSQLSRIIRLIKAMK